VVQPEERLKIADRFTLIPAGPDEFRLHSLNFSLALSGRSADLVSRLLPLLDGGRTVQAIVDELGSFGDDRVHNALEDLLQSGAVERVTTEQGGLFSDHEVGRFRGQIAFFSHFVTPPEVPSDASRSSACRSGAEYQHRLKQAHVTVVGVGRLGSQLIRSLAVSGVGKITAIDVELVSEDDQTCDSWFGVEHAHLSRVDAAEMLCRAANPALEFHAVRDAGVFGRLSELLRGCDFAVLCPDHVNPSEYEAFNQAALAAKTPWTSARLAGFEFHVGPTVIPGETPCFQCFTLRLKSNLPDYSEYLFVEEYLRRERLRPATLAMTPGIGLLALEVVKALTWFSSPATYAHLYSLNLLTLQSGLHPVLKIPRCPACGRPSAPRPTIHVWQQSEANRMS
jgi:bacteriocin biosynthesis cyclodehydratase domain-containing protein